MYEYEPSADEISTQDIGFKTPWWSFSGLIVIILLQISVHMSDVSTQKKLDAFIENPTVETYFTFKNTEDGNKTPYVFGKIVGFEEDKIIVRLSHYAYSRESMASQGATDAKANPNLLEPEVFRVQKDDFKNLNIQSLVD